MSKFLHGPPKFSRGPPVGDRWFSVKNITVYGFQVKMLHSYFNALYLHSPGRLMNILYKD
jgi:hypothetical protein